MPIITLSKVTKVFGTQVLLEDVTLAVNEGDKIGVVGANGSGKTTLLRLLADLDEPTKGEVHIARGTRIGYLDQEPDFSGHGSVLEAALSAFARVHELEAEIAAVHERLEASPPDADRLLRRQGDLEHEFERLGGYTCRQRTEAVLHGLGFHGAALEAPVDQLSGGERSRLAIAHLLVQDADVLLLDEPTNHLDVEGLEWLEGFVAGFHGAVVVVSHDRHFLDRVAERIFDFQGTGVDVYKGNYSAYVPQKAERLAHLRKLYDAQQAYLAKEAGFIQRYIAGQRGREARGRRKRLERVERLEAPTARKVMQRVRIEPAVRGGNEVLNLEGLGKSFEGRRLFAGLTLQVVRGDRIGIVGPNGAGKTTLLRIIMGEERPDEGSARLGHKVLPGYYRQDRLDLDPERTVLDEVWAMAPQQRAGELRSLLGMFLFTEDDVFKRVGGLSGGEQARVALAKLILSAPNLLLLDEPTNHLDIPSRLCLENALEAYDGTAIVVSHDRYLLDRTVDRILEIKDGEARLYYGGYSRYAQEVRGGKTAGPPRAREPRRGPSRAPRRSAKRKTRPLKVVEGLILEREEAVETLQHAMGDPELYKSPETARSLSSKLKGIRAELASLYDEWDEAVDNASGS